jgi:hypothetical protein
MGAIRACRRAPVAALVVAVLAVPPGLVAQSTATSGAARTPAPLPAGTDIGWPRHYELSEGAGATLYQPSIGSWENQKRMVAWAALAYEPRGVKQPTLGTLRFEATTSVSPEERLVSFADFRIAEINFPTLERSVTERLSTDHDARARAEGAQRTHDYGSYRSAPIRERGGSFRESRAGGGRRR